MLDHSADSIRAVTADHATHLTKNLVLSGGTPECKSNNRDHQNYQRRQRQDRIEGEGSPKAMSLVLVPCRERLAESRPNVFQIRGGSSLFYSTA
jgi:hypothetical protein